jgi:hypothetical protein
VRSTVLYFSAFFILTSAPDRGEAQSCVDTAGFVRTRGTDTLLIETFATEGNRHVGVQFSRDGITGYTVVQSATPRLVQAEVALWSPGRSMRDEPDQEGRFGVFGDTAVMSIRSGSLLQVQSVHFPSGATVLLDLAVGLEEFLTRAAKATGRTAVRLPALYLASGGYSPTVEVRFVAKDSVQLTFANGDIVANLGVDSIGRILGGSYTNSTGERVRVARIGCRTADSLVKARGRP